MNWFKENKIVATLIIILIVTGIYYFWGGKETWIGFYYPDGCLICEDQYIYSPPFDNRASCLAWATSLKAQRNNLNDKFECGKNCKTPDEKGGLYVCEETVDY